MIIVDNALRRRVSSGLPPIQVAILGAGFLARGVALQLAAAFKGAIRVAGIANRTLDHARRTYAAAGERDPAECATTAEVEVALRAGRPVICQDPHLLATAPGIDVMLEATGTVEAVISPLLAAIESGKHVVVNAEIDGTIGPILRFKATAAGVLYTGIDGDQPAATMNLVRFVRGIGLRPALCGNIKGLQDPYRTPTTQAGFAQRSGQSASMVTSFADGTKISFEQAVTANATGMRVAKRGMHGYEVPPGTPIEEAALLFQPDELLQGPGLVDYVIGASPGPGIFVLAATDNEWLKPYLELYKLGPGPLYCFHTPYHLCNLEVPLSIARAVLFGDVAIAPIGAPTVEVVATTKRDLRAGEVLDGMGRYMTYGVAENADVTRRENLLPIGVAEGCRLRRDLPKDATLTYADVILPPGRLCDRLRAEQARLFETDDPRDTPRSALSPA
ncbi:MAG: NAD(P)-dependent oxidoreductase [Afipia sp.]|nr:NAD(P)-dependent oxidoreductase [Afipia sp.]